MPASLSICLLTDLKSVSTRTVWSNDLDSKTLILSQKALFESLKDPQLEEALKMRR